MEIFSASLSFSYMDFVINADFFIWDTVVSFASLADFDGANKYPTSSARWVCRGFLVRMLHTPQEI